MRVACLTDFDVMPDCATGLISRELPTRSKLGEQGLLKHREELQAKAEGQSVRSFVADRWTFEYDLAYCGLAEDVYIAAHLANRKHALGDSEFESESAIAAREFASLKEECDRSASTSTEPGQELLATRMYAQILKRPTANATRAPHRAPKRLGRPAARRRSVSPLSPL